MKQHRVPPILCVGITSCLQRTLFFPTLRTGKVNRATRVIETASGKGTNVVRVIQSLGGYAHLLSVQGGDTGERFATFLRDEGLSCSLIPSQHPTRICQTLLDESDDQVTELVEESGPLTPQEIASLHDQLQDGLQQSRWLVIAGCPPPVAPVTLYHDFIQQAHTLGCRVILDAQKQPLLAALCANPWLVKLNQEELGLTLGRSIHTADQTKEAAELLIERGAQNVVVTQGANEVWWVWAQGACAFQPPRVPSVNPIGSGDAMTAGIVFGMAGGDSLADSLRLGIACGAANALTWTSGVVERASVEELLLQVQEKGHQRS